MCVCVCIPTPRPVMPVALLSHSPLARSLSFSLSSLSHFSYSLLSRSLLSFNSSIISSLPIPQVQQDIQDIIKKTSSGFVHKCYKKCNSDQKKAIETLPGRPGSMGMKIAFLLRANSNTSLAACSVNAIGRSHLYAYIYITS